jgi:hypothetical protein
MLLGIPFNEMECLKDCVVEPGISHRQIKAGEENGNNPQQVFPLGFPNHFLIVWLMVIWLKLQNYFKKFYRHSYTYRSENQIPMAVAGQHQKQTTILLS